MPKARIIPTLLTDGVSLVKGTGFDSWRTVGSIIGAARVFALRDVDELVLLDVSASRMRRTINPATVQSVADCLDIPLTVGGGIRTLETISQLLRVGADKVVIGTAGLLDFTFLQDAVNHFGSQAIVVSLDFIEEPAVKVLVECGAVEIPYTLAECVEHLKALQVGEILLQAIQRDGHMSGYALDVIGQVTDVVEMPVIASGGCGKYADMAAALSAGASAVAAGSIFQFTEQTPRGARDFLHNRGFNVRLD